MKEKEQKADDFTIKELALRLGIIIAFLTATSGFSLHLYGDKIKRLRESCIAEEIIDEKGNPGGNFRLYLSSPCNDFVNSDDIKRNYFIPRFGAGW